MITIGYSIWVNNSAKEYNKKEHFRSLEEFKEWVHDNTAGDINDPFCVHWPHTMDTNVFYFKNNIQIYYHIDFVKEDNGILYSSGYYTNHQYHIAQSFCERCIRRIKEQRRMRYNFED